MCVHDDGRPHDCKNKSIILSQSRFGHYFYSNIYGHAPRGPRAHWTYWLQILSKLCFQRVVLSGNYEIVAICSDKNTFLMTLIIKLTLGNIFIKVKNPPGGATVTN
jgi:hypothetical protein